MALVFGGIRRERRLTNISRRRESSSSLLAAAMTLHERPLPAVYEATKMPRLCAVPPNMFIAVLLDNAEIVDVTLADDEEFEELCAVTGTGLEWCRTDWGSSTAFSSLLIDSCKFNHLYR